MKPTPVPGSLANKCLVIVCTADYGVIRNGRAAGDGAVCGHRFGPGFSSGGLIHEPGRQLRRGGWSAHEAFGVGEVGGSQHVGPADPHSCGPAVVDVSVRPGGLDRSEAAREAGPVLQVFNWASEQGSSLLTCGRL
jgi:hypothetical protein